MSDVAVRPEILFTEPGQAAVELEPAPHQFVAAPWPIVTPEIAEYARKEAMDVWEHRTSGNPLFTHEPGGNNTLELVRLPFLGDTSTAEVTPSLDQYLALAAEYPALYAAIDALFVFSGIVDSEFTVAHRDHVFVDMHRDTPGNYRRAIMSVSGPKVVEFCDADLHELRLNDPHAYLHEWDNPERTKYLKRETGAPYLLTFSDDREAMPYHGASLNISDTPEDHDSIDIYVQADY